MICHLTLVSEAWLHLVTHTTSQELLLTPFPVHEILGFEILSSEKHFCHWEISEILFRVRGLDPWYMYICMYSCICMHIHMQARLFTSINTYLHMHIHTQKSKHTTHTHIPGYTHALTHTHIRTRILSLLKFPAIFFNCWKPNFWIFWTKLLNDLLWPGKQYLRKHIQEKHCNSTNFTLDYLTMSMHPHEHDYIKSLIKKPGRPLISICPEENANSPDDCDYRHW